MRAKRLVVGLGLATLFAAPAASAQGSKASAGNDLGHKADKLKPGQWVWAPEIAPEGPIHIYVDLKKQRATVYRNGLPIGVTTVSSGKPGYETPTGIFTILQKDIDHRSNKYNNAPMRYMQRLTWDGVALHAGRLPGYPESHGCVHLPLPFAKLLFAATNLGVTVVVADGESDPVGKQAVADMAPTPSKTVLDPEPAAKGE